METDIQAGDKATVFLFLIAFAGIAVAAAPESPNTKLGPNPLYDDFDAWCTGTYDDPDGDPGSMNFTWKVSGNIVKTNLYSVTDEETLNRTLDTSNFDEPQIVLCNVTAIDPGDGNTSDWDETRAVTEAPTVIEGPTFYNYTETHEFNVSAFIYDPELQEDIDQCDIEAEDQDGNIQAFNMNMDKSYGNKSVVYCFHSSIDDSGGFEVIEDINVTVIATDDDNDENQSSEVNAIPNSVPTAYNVYPPDDSIVSTSTVTLEASFLDRNGEQIDVWFYNSTGSPPELLESWVNVPSGDTRSEDWMGLESFRTYTWYIKMSDGYETVRERFRFRNLISNRFRVQTSFQIRYSSIITSSNGGVVPYTVRNTASTSKNLNTSLDGLNALYASNNKSFMTYTLSPGERRTFRIRMRPDDLGKKTLKVTTDNLEFNIETVDTVNVLVRPKKSSAPDMPGIGALQLVFLVLVSTTLYYSGLL
ncbi:MAG: hypothetical protein ABEJ36_05035 [Candidatus Nanosalina sp.]